MEIKNILLLFTTFSTGLMAGLFYSWSFSVTLGLSKLSDTNYIEAMKSLNRSILNPAFFLIFLGSIFSLPVTTYFYHENSIIFGYLLIASLIYFTGSIAVTFFGNVPLNNLLAAFEVKSSSQEEINIRRKTFESRWNKLNMIRTLSSLITFVLLTIACIKINN